MLAHRLLRWPNIDPESGKRVMLLSSDDQSGNTEKQLPVSNVTVLFKPCYTKENNSNCLLFN